MKISNCCGSERVDEDIMICPVCKDHCDIEFGCDECGEPCDESEICDECKNKTAAVTAVQ